MMIINRDNMKRIIDLFTKAVMELEAHNAEYKHVTSLPIIQEMKDFTLQLEFLYNQTTNTPQGQ